VLDNFDTDFASDSRNVRIGLVTNGLSLFNTDATHTLVAPYLLFHTIYHILFA
jgi:hypothetical protein